MSVYAPITIPDVEQQLDPGDYRLLGEMLTKLAIKRASNQVRQDYYDMSNLFEDLGIAIPPVLRNLQVAMGWPAKAVDLLARRIRPEGFVLPGADVESWGIPQIWTDNRMEIDATQAITSTLINPPSFLFTSVGDTASGEPPAVIYVADALRATGIWNPARRNLTAALAVLTSDYYGPTRLIMITGRTAYGMTRSDDDTGANRWEVRAVQHGLGRVPVEPLIYRPNLGREFGSSRISPAVRSITNSAMRTVVRSEVGAEFFSAPQRYLLDVDEDQFQGPNGERRSTWDLVMGRILALPTATDEDGEPLPTPTVGQFPQISMQPHVDHFRMWASMFAGETGLPLASLGVPQDNPSSAEAIFAAKEDLVTEAEGAALGLAPAFTRAMITAVQLRDQLRTPPFELRQLAIRWRDPSTPSRSAAADAVLKQIAAGALPATSDVALEQLGYDPATIARIQTDRSRSVALSGSGSTETPAAPREAAESAPVGLREGAAG